MARELGKELYSLLTKGIDTLASLKMINLMGKANIPERIMILCARAIGPIIR